MKFNKGSAACRLPC